MIPPARTLERPDATVRSRFGRSLTHGSQEVDVTSPRKLTETYINRLPFEGRPYAVRDTHTTGLMVAVNKNSKSYKVQRDLWRGQRGRRRLVKTVRHTLGTTDELTLDAARTRAQEVIAQIKRGVDPNAPDVDCPERKPWPPVPKSSGRARGGMFTPPGATDTIATRSLQYYGTPLRPGDRIYSTGELLDCSPLKKTALGPGYFQTNLSTYYNQHDEIVGTNVFELLRYGIPENAANAADA